MYSWVVRFVAGLLLAFVQLAGAKQPPRQRVGPYEITLLLPTRGLYAGEEMEIEFKVERFGATDEEKQRSPLLSARIRGEVDMPSMPAMARFDEVAHREGIPGVYGIHPTFPHGGDYRLCLTVLPPEVQPVDDPRPTTPFSYDFPLTVYDAVSSPRAESAKTKPYVLDLTMEPRQPMAGQPVEMELRIRYAYSLDLREVTDFDVQHERLMHLFVVSSDLQQFAHEHPVLAGPGVFRLRYAFPAPGEYRLFVDVAPKDAGAQVLSVAVTVGGQAIQRRSPPEPTLRASISLPEEGLRAGKTTIIESQIHDTRGNPVGDLEPWLGAMGHLLLIHADAQTFVHAHPDDRDRGIGQDGRIPFLVRLPKPGSYKGWLQVQRKGKVETIELELEATPPY